MVSKILVILMVVFLALVAYFFLFQVSGQEQTQEKWTSYYTKAFCSRSFCEDIEVYCRSGTVVKIVPTGFTIQNSRGIPNPEQELCGG